MGEQREGHGHTVTVVCTSKQCAMLVPNPEQKLPLEEEQRTKPIQFGEEEPVSPPFYF